MKLDRRHMVASVIMLVASIVYNVWVFTGGSRTTSQNQSSAPAEFAPSETGGANGGPIDPANVRALPDVALDSDPFWPRNPFESLLQRPREEVIAEAPAPRPAPQPDPVVASILYSSDRRAAMIDGHIVRIGDAVSTGTVVDIQPRAVVVDSPDKGRYSLELKQAMTPVSQK